MVTSQNDPIQNIHKNVHFVVLLEAFQTTNLQLESTNSFLEVYLKSVISPWKSQNFLACGEHRIPPIQWIISNFLADFEIHEISDFLAKPSHQILDFRVGWIYLLGHSERRLAGLRSREQFACSWIVFGDLSEAMTNDRQN